ncbi:hypothetical protein P9112_000340 [Eukaryota sp. TZLM1-RC]
MQFSTFALVLCFLAAVNAEMFRTSLMGSYSADRGLLRLTEATLSDGAYFNPPPSPVVRPNDNTMYVVESSKNWHMVQHFNITDHPLCREEACFGHLVGNMHHRLNGTIGVSVDHFTSVFAGVLLTYPTMVYGIQDVEAMRVDKYTGTVVPVVPQFDFPFPKEVNGRRVVVTLNFHNLLGEELTLVAAHVEGLKEEMFPKSIKKLESVVLDVEDSDNFNFALSYSANNKIIVFYGAFEQAFTAGVINPDHETQRLGVSVAKEFVDGDVELLADLAAQ